MSVAAFVKVWFWALATVACGLPGNRHGNHVGAKRGRGGGRAGSKQLLPSPVPKHPTTTLPKAQIENEDLLLSLLFIWEALLTLRPQQYFLFFFFLLRL